VPFAALLILAEWGPFANCNSIPENRKSVIMKRMPLRKFGAIVARVMETLPAELKPYLDNVVVDVEEEPDVETLRRMSFTEKDIAEGESLYGLFAPMELPTGWSDGAVHLPDLPHRIIIYKRPLEESFSGRRRLMIEIRKTVIHELAHHFGYTDRDLERFDDNPDPFGDEPEEDSPQSAPG
jgi:predicted Zn-dependent protease with MMP-like domain